MDQHKTIALLGATGKAGQYILTAFLNKGYKVKALIRKPETFIITHPLLEIIPGDIKDLDTARLLIKDSHAVIAAIGPRKDEPLISSLSTQNILKAMGDYGIKRFIMLAGLNLDAPGDDKSAENIAKTDWMRRMFPDAVADRQKAYNILAASNADWTMIRLPWIEQTNERRGLIIDLKDCPAEKISTTDLADFIIEQLEDKIYIQQAPFVASK